MWTPRYSVKWTGFSVLLVPGSYNDNGDTGMPLTQDCLAPLIDSTTGHYNNTVMHSTSLWLAFLDSVQQGREPELLFSPQYCELVYCHSIVS